MDQATTFLKLCVKVVANPVYVGFLKYISTSLLILSIGNKTTKYCN